MTKLTTLAAGVATLATLPAEANQPNVILVMCDDLGWGDVGFNGNETIKTPNIDRMAQEGVTFERFYSASAVSSPTRASVLTGRNPMRTGVFNANVGILRPEEITIPELLSDAGYATGHFGKWHLGTLTTAMKDANRGRKGNLKEYNPPALHGYDVAFVTESKVPTWDPMKKPVGKTSGGGWNALAEGDESLPYGTSYWDIEGKRVNENLEGDDSRVVMDRVLPFIKENHEAGKPSLSVVWFHTPHKPCVAGPEYFAMYQGTNDFRNYAGCITAMDVQMGRLRQFLEDEKMLDNTIIWFCSDNGPERCSKNGGGVTGGFKARKRSLHEGGVRVPAFAFGGGVAAGIRSDFPASTCDYLPTIVELAGVSKSQCKNELDGVSLAKLVMKGERGVRKAPIVACYAGQVSYSDEKCKIYLSKGGVLEYYDIVNDPYEKSPRELTKSEMKLYKAMIDRLKRYRYSFECGEYGTQSFDKMGQSWDPDSLLGSELIGY